MHMSEANTQNSVQNEAMESTKYTYRYHNDSLTVLNVLILGLVGLIASLGVFMFLQFVSKPKAVHFPLDAELQIIKPVPLDQEGISTAALLNWVNEFVIKAFSFNYSNVQRQQSILAPYFSDAAMKVYLDLLNTNETFQSIAENKFVVSIVPRSTPDILVGRAFRDRFAWQIEVPAQLVFANALIRSTQDIVFNFLVWRVPAEESDLGVLVATFTYRIDGRIIQQPIRIF